MKNNSCKEVDQTSIVQDKMNEIKTNYLNAIKNFNRLNINLC